ncbi:MAG: glycosyltransferase family 9 protein [Alphaproteobacteria bacterium]|nr:glycosyltransferase family 9 protein [Alphaproteobacteria bacterium]
MLTKRRLRALADPFAWKAGARRAEGKVQEGLLLIEAGGLGDVMMLSCLIDVFRPLADAGEPITLVLRKESAKAAFTLPPDVRVEIRDFYRLMTDSLYRFRTLADLRAQNFRKVVSLDWRRHPWMDDALLMAAAHGSAFSAAFHPKPWPKFGNALEKNARRLTQLVEAPRPARMIERWLFLAEALTGTKPPPFSLRFHQTLLAVPAEPLDRPTILFSPFVSSRDRQPLPDFWETLALEFQEFDIKLLAGPGDIERNLDFAGMASRLGVIERPFPDLLPLFKAARLVIATDSATMHLASLSGVPTLSLSAAAYQGEVLPHAKAYAPANLKVMVADMPCKGCIGDCTLPFRGERYECVARLDVNETVKLANEMLKTAPDA